MIDPKDNNRFFSSIPKRALKALVRCVLPAIQEYYERAGQRTIYKVGNPAETIEERRQYVEHTAAVPLCRFVYSNNQK